MILDEWAAFYAIHPVALADLKQRLGVNAPTPMPPVAGGATDTVELPGSEGRQQSLVRIEAAQKGIRLWRNNVGVLRDKNDVPVRFGLANDSKALNEVIKSADLIGWTPTVIEQRMVGMTFALFTSVEVKHEGWHYRGDAHEKAQLAWANLVIAGGGRALFVTGPGAL